MFVGTLRLQLAQPRFLPYLQQLAILVESLVNDVFQPWPMNNMQATWKYHDGTKHSYWSIRNSPHNITKEVFMKQFTRRAILENTTLAAASAGIRLPLLSSEASSEPSSTSRKLKIIVCGAHPDDPESGCGGTIALYSDLGHDVAMLYLTRGEAGIQGKSAQETAAIRTAECQKACAILRARPIFGGQIDGNTEVSPSRYNDFQKILQAEQPDIVFTHWPIDTHRDHRSASLLVYDAWVGNGRKFDLYYFEVDQGWQTQQFNPTTYVDISRTEGRKRAACFAHGSQQPEQGFYQLHERMNRFRGMEARCELAEGFVRHFQNFGLSVPER